MQREKGFQLVRVDDVCFEVAVLVPLPYGIGNKNALGLIECHVGHLACAVIQKFERILILFGKTGIRLTDFIGHSKN